MNLLCVTCTFRTMMTHALVQCIKHTCHGRMLLTACPQMARHVFYLTYHESVAPLALDVLSMPASEAYAERVFSVCGYLSAGRRNGVLVYEQ